MDEPPPSHATHSGPDRNSVGSPAKAENLNLITGEHPTLREIPENNWLQCVKNANVTKYKTKDVFQAGHTPNGFSFAMKDFPEGNW